MALRDILKRKKSSETEKKEKPVEKQKEVKKETPVVSKKPRKMVKDGLAFRILKSPHITEKTTDLIKKNQYTFKVYLNANKIEIRKAIEKLYKVKVLKVRIIKMPRKRRRLGRISGWRKGYKKAIVRIKQGQKIEELLR